MLNFKIIPSLYYCLIFLALMSGSGHAFYQTDESSALHVFQMERNYSLDGKEQNTVTFYDNFNHFSAKKTPTSTTCPHSEVFIPSDLVTVNLPIHIAIRAPVTAEDSLANVVYANLKLRQLLEKQNSLQQRARDALAGLDVPFVRFQGSLFPKIPSQGPSIEKELKDLTRSQQNAARNPETSILSNSETLTTFRTRLQNPADEPLYLQAGPSRQRAVQRPLYLPSSALEEEVDRDPTPSALPPEQAVEREEQQKAPIKSAYDKPSELPWFIRALKSAFLYLFAHPVEGVFYVLFLSLVLAAFPSRRKR